MRLPTVKLHAPANSQVACACMFACMFSILVFPRIASPFQGSFMTHAMSGCRPPAPETAVSARRSRFLVQKFTSALAQILHRFPELHTPSEYASLYICVCVCVCVCVWHICQSKHLIMFMAVGGIKSGEPTGWGVMVCEKAKLTMSNTVIEYAHQVKGKRSCAKPPATCKTTVICVAETCHIMLSLTCCSIAHGAGPKRGRLVPREGTRLPF
jgi:hypothetical protein